MSECTCKPEYTGPYIQAMPFTPTLKEFKEAVERNSLVMKCEHCLGLEKRVEELERTLGLTLHRNIEQGERIAYLEAEKIRLNAAIINFQQYQDTLMGRIQRLEARIAELEKKNSI